MATYRRIRVRFYERNGTLRNDVQYAFQRLELLDSAGTPLDLSGATITTSLSDPGGSVIGSTANLIDGNASTYLAFDLVTPDGDYATIDIVLPSAQEVAGIALTAHDTINGADVYGVRAFRVWGYYDSSSTYGDDLYSSYASTHSEYETDWALNERRQWSWWPETVPVYRYYRLRIDSADASATYAAVGEISFMSVADLLYYGSPYDRPITVSGSPATPAANAFDQDTYTSLHWGSGGGVQTVDVDFGTATGVAAVDIFQCDPLLGTAPTAGAVLGSSDGTTWAELGSFTAPSTYPVGSVRIALSATSPSTQNQVLIAAPVACAAARLLALSDFTAAVDAAAPVLFVADVIDNEGNVTRVPISSWQGTLQIGVKSYAQCVVPNAAPYVDVIVAGQEFVISRVGRLLTKEVIETVVARAPLQTYSLAHGPYNYTATISGYGDPFPIIDNADARYARVLNGVRTFTQTPENFRLRSDIDWLLRPGFIAAAPGFPEFTVSYVNYYANKDDAYMDAGSRTV